MLGLGSGVRVRVGGVAGLCLRRRSCSRFRGVTHRVVAGPARATARAAARLPRAALCPSAAAARPRPAEALFEALDSLVEPVLNRLFMPVQPAGAGTCAGTERDGLGSPTCTCHYARLLARAACQHEWGLPPLSFLSDSLSFFNSSCFSASSWGGYASRRAGSSSSAVACATDPAAS